MSDWILPSYASQTLIVGVAKGQIGDFRVPPAAEQGELIGTIDLPLAIGVRNVGESAGSIQVNIYDGYTYVWAGFIDLAVGAFGWLYPEINYPMPNRDLVLTAMARTGTVVDSSMTKTIKLVVKVSTSITLTLDPSSVGVGKPYHYKGRLTQTGTSTGLSGLTVVARRLEADVWKDVSTGVTDAGGYYDLTANAPTAAGSFNCMAAFLGIVPSAGEWFLPSSAQTSLTTSGVWTFPYEWLIPEIVGVLTIVFTPVRR